MSSIEVEIRSFIPKEKFRELKEFFDKNAKFLGEDEQETVYLDGDKDIRMQKNSKYAKLWRKEGKMHDAARKEEEVRFPRENFDRVLKCITLFFGFGVKSKWLRKRLSYTWDEISVSLDDTKGYGLILELEKMVSMKAAEKTKSYLKRKMKELGIKITPREVFEKKFNYYTRNWKKLIR